MPMGKKVLAGLDQQVEKLRSQLAALASGDIRRQQSVGGGAWHDCVPDDIHNLTNLIGTLKALAMLLRDPPPDAP